MSAHVRTLDGWFRQGLARNPAGEALRLPERSWTYAELHDTACAWGSALARVGARRVGILAARSHEAYAGFLAALYAGAAAVPLGPETPLPRNVEFAGAAGVDALIADAAGDRHLAAFAEAVRPRVIIAPARGAQPDADPGFVPVDRRAADEIAYILSTSGSTGRPKGVPIGHGNIGAFVAACLARYDVGPSDTFSHVHELTFDLSMFEMFVAWGCGARVYPLNRLQALDPVRHLNAGQVTVTLVTPSLAQQARATGRVSPGGLPGLRYLAFCGEALPTTTAAFWRSVAPHCPLDNLYGPTELTVACVAYRWELGEPVPSGGSVPIGHPHPGLDHLLYDPDRGVVADRGELCVTGPQMFSGYLDPADDHDRFLTHDGQRWYRTGDRVESVGTSGLRCLNRVDDQVKIRGYRVELGEVEHAIRAVAGVAACAVAAEGPDGPVLVAFVLDGGDVDLPALGRGLAERLPAYLVPARLWRLGDTPLNTNGKADRAVLREEAGRRLAGAAGPHREPVG